MKQPADMSFARATPTTRGGYFPIPGDPIRNLYLGTLTQLREKVEDSHLAGYTKTLLMQKLDQCSGPGLSAKLKDKVIQVTKVLLEKNKVEKFKHELLKTFPGLLLLEYKKGEERCIDGEYTLLIKEERDLNAVKTFLWQRGYTDFNSYDWLERTGDQQIFPALCVLSITFEKYFELNNINYYYIRTIPYCKGIQMLLDKVEKEKQNE